MNSVAEVLVRQAEERPGHVAIRDEYRSCTYEQLLQEAFRIGRAAQEAGLHPGEPAGILFPNGADFVAAYFGILAAGGVAVPLNAEYRRNEVLHFIRSCGLRMILTSRFHEERCREFAPLIQEVGLRCPILFVEKLRESAAGLPGVVPVPPGQPIMFQFSSGSTGVPKRIARTHGQLLWELETLRSTLVFSPEDRFLGVAPFSHVNGLVRTMLSAIYAGATLYPLAGFDRRKVAELIERERLSVFIAVPFMFCILADSRFASPPDFSSLRWCVSASAPMPVGANRRFRERFGRYVRQLYGSTETGSISVNLDPDPADSLASVGTPLPGIRVAVQDEQGRPLGPGEEGELVVRSPGAITGYLDLPEANREAFRDGVFLTGDVGKMDPKGRIYLLGRKKFFINKGGYKINPQEIEDLLAGHPAVREVAVVGLPTAFDDEKIKAVVVAESPVSPEDLIAFCRGKIADFKIPSLFEFREELPRSPTGKIRKKLLLESEG
ncbi:MAG: long-chain fatty acid--CoA ligase [Acidobacteriota bacterium]